MDLETKFKKETGCDAYADNDLRPKVPSDYYVEWLEAKINYTLSCETLPNESEMMHKRYTEYHLAIKNLETIESGSFYSGFRRCWSWLKSYELVED